jgi:hypothetical protein
MSLIAGDTYLTRLYQLAQVSPDVEHEALSFWDYYLSKRVFTDDQFHVDAEKPASSETDPRRRVDRVVRYFENGTLQLQVLIFVEAKKHGATRNKILEVERQAHEACGTSCGATGHSHVYAMTIWGTRARLWKFDASSGSLTPLFGEGEYGHLDSYVDANSSRAVQIKDGLNSMKALPPSLYHGQTYEQIGATRFVEPIQVYVQNHVGAWNLLTLLQSAYSTWTKPIERGIGPIHYGPNGWGMALASQSQSILQVR